MLGSPCLLSPSHLGSSQWLRYVGGWPAGVPGGTVAWSLLSASVDAPGGFLALAARWSYSLNEFDAGVMAALSDSPACIVGQVHFMHRSCPGRCRVSFW